MRYQGWGLVKVLKLKLSWDFEAEVWSRFWNWHWSRYWGWSLVEILWLKIGHHFEPEVWRFWSWSLESYCSSQPRSFKWLRALSFLAHWFFYIETYFRFIIFSTLQFINFLKDITLAASLHHCDLIIWLSLYHDLMIIISWFHHIFIIFIFLTISTTPTKQFMNRYLLE